MKIKSMEAAYVQHDKNLWLRVLESQEQKMIKILWFNLNFIF